MRLAIFALLTVVSVNIVGCGSMKVRGDAVTKEAYLASAEEGANKIAGRTKVSGYAVSGKRFIIAPLVLTYEFRDEAGTSQYSSVQAWWDAKDQATEFITLANFMFQTVNNVFKEAGYETDFTPEAGLANLGRTPRSEIGKGYTVASYKMRQYTPRETSEILKAVPADAVVFVHARMHLHPQNLVDVNTVMSMNYHAYHQYDVSICTATSCVRAEAPMLRTQVMADLDHQVPIPRVDERSNPKLNEQNEFANELIARAVIFGLAKKFDSLVKPN